MYYFHIKTLARVFTYICQVYVVFFPLNGLYLFSTYFYYTFITETFDLNK